MIDSGCLYEVCALKVCLRNLCLPQISTGTDSTKLSNVVLQGLQQAVALHAVTIKSEKRNKHATAAPQWAFTKQGHGELLQSKKGAGTKCILFNSKEAMFG